LCSHLISPSLYLVKYIMLKFFKKLIKYITDSQSELASMGIYSVITPVGSWTYIDSELLKIYLKKVEGDQSSTK